MIGTGDKRARDAILLRPGCASILNQYKGYEPHPVIFLDDTPILCEAYVYER